MQPTAKFQYVQLLSKTDKHNILYLVSHIFHYVLLF